MNKPHKDLDAWKIGMALIKEVYRMTAGFPAAELYGLVAQMRRAATSIPSNIAEGAARQTKRDFVRFLYISKGSLSELDTQIAAALRLGFVDPAGAAAALELAEKEDQILSGLIRRNVSRFPIPVSRLP